MATDKKISQLSSGAPAQAGDEYVVARSGANYKLTGTDLLGLVTGTANTFSAAQTFSNPASFADGSASAPAVTNTGDTDTGVYFPAANEVAVTTGGTVAAGFNSNGLFFRNRIINGDMRIDQRNAGAAVTASGTYPVDRLQVAFSTDGAFSAQQDTNAPAGFVNSVKWTTTTADASLGATQFGIFQQKIEGTNVADLGWGTANARTVTLSFWVRSSLTGTFGGSVRNSANNRAYPFTYSISVADTWEYKTVTIPGDTAGTWLTTTGVGIAVGFSLGAGADRSGTAGAWTGTSDIFSVTGAVSVIGTLNATWYVTGVQLETGSVATPFERRPYGTELMLCQRYLPALFNPAASGLNITTSAAYIAMPFPVQARVPPTGVTMSVAGALYSTAGASYTITSTTFVAAGVSGAFVQPAIATTSLTATQPAFLYSGYYLFTGAEL